MSLTIYSGGHSSEEKGKGRQLFSHRGGIILLRQGDVDICGNEVLNIDGCRSEKKRVGKKNMWGSEFFYEATAAVFRIHEQKPGGG